MNIKNYENNEDILTVDNEIQKEVNPNETINKEVTLQVLNLENIKNDYILDFFLFDDKNNIIKNSSSKVVIKIKNNQPKQNSILNDEEKLELFNKLKEDYNLDAIGVDMNKFNNIYNEYLSQCEQNISKEDFMEGVSTYIIDKLF